MSVQRISDRTANRRLGSRRGNAILEFAISSLILVPLFTGVFQFGYTMYLYNELITAVRAGARYASLADISNAGGTTCAWQSAYTTAVQNMVVYGDPAPSGTPSPLVPGLTTAKVSVTVECDTNKATPKNVTVKIGTGGNSYTVDAVFKTFTFSGKPTFTTPYFGTYCSTAATGQGNATC